MSENEDQEMVHYVIVRSTSVQTTRELLESMGILKKSVPIFKEQGNAMGIPILEPSIDTIERLRDSLGDANIILKSRHAPVKRLNHRDKLIEKIKIVMGEQWRPNLEEEIPRHWEKHSDLLLIPESSFKDPQFERQLSRILEILQESLKVNRIARKFRIESDDFRSPSKVEFLTPTNNFWAERHENGVIYTWDVRKSMFSLGNITEKLRIGSFNCEGETVVDLFAGIGYFSLPYLIKARASHLHAIEWNPGALEALKKNLDINKVSPERYTLYFGDNRKMCPLGIADRVNLGLIPSSELSWKTACEALRRDTGGILHIHGNVDSSGFGNTKEALKDWGTTTQGQIGNILGDKWTSEILHIENIKSYGPKIYHAVLDLKCIPS